MDHGRLAFPGPGFQNLAPPKAWPRVADWGGIVVNARMQTSDPDIYAAGDCVALPHLVTGKETYAPLGSLANREGRVAGDNMAGIPSQFPGWWAASS